VASNFSTQFFQISRLVVSEKSTLSPTNTSWAERLSILQRDGLEHAAICGLDGASWFQVTDGSDITQAELSNLLWSMDQETIL
jgi:hypothetical protein